MTDLELTVMADNTLQETSNGTPVATIAADETGFDVSGFTSSFASQATSAIQTVATGLVPVLVVSLIVSIAFKYFKKFGKG